MSVKAQTRLQTRLRPGKKGHIFLGWNTEKPVTFVFQRMGGMGLFLLEPENARKMLELRQN